MIKALSVLLIDDNPARAEIVEAARRLAREVRPLRIYEGTSEIQKLLIAAELLKESEAAS